MKKKVFVSFIEAGQGHLMTAQAICEQLEQNYGDEIEVIKYAYKDSGIKEFEDFENFCVGEVHKANRHKTRLFFQMVLMHCIGQNNTLKLSYNVKFNKFKKKVAEVYNSYKPDLILTTYYGDLHCALWAKSKGLIDATVTAYNPDHNTHGWWDKRVEMFFCNNELAYKEAIEKSKMKKENVFQVNFMSRASLKGVTENKQFYREKYGIPVENFTVILADGAYGFANMEKFTDELLSIDLPITIIPVCGKNEELYNKYSVLKEFAPKNITLLPQKFIPYIAELYKASDIFITKAGPNAITDCVFMHTPIMTNFYTGPIEKASSKLFTEIYKTGVYCPNAKQAKDLIVKYMKDQSLLVPYIKNTEKFDVNKNGAKDVADLIAQKLGIQIKK